MAHAYPADLAQFVRRAWTDGSALESEYCEFTPEQEALPEPEVLETILSTCYQASLLREEERPVRFRLIVASADGFPPPGGPPHGLHRLLFSEPRAFTQHELRRLAPGVDFYRTLIGAQVDPRNGLVLWGVVVTGPRWVQAVYGGRQSFQRLPANLVVRVTAPGRLAVCKGLLTLATLVGGRIVQRSIDIFDSTWLPAVFADVREELLALHRSARERASTRWAELDPDVTRIIAQHVVRQIIGLVRNAHHGGTIVFLPPEGEGSIEKLDGRILPKYGFAPEEPRRRFRTLIVAVLNALAACHPPEPGRRVGWPEYASSSNGGIAQLDEALFELAHLIAGFAAIDGAVVLSKRFELLGFGAEIGGDLPAVRWVARALDAEGTEKVRESVENVGTRHRSAYRLCNFVHDAVAIVVSQDGTVRVVKWHDGEVTYWDHVSTSVLDL
ncbi:MAG: putative sensor domain DACNV-containing protein [Thermodesulfobacteriota bacterium]